MKKIMIACFSLVLIVSCTKNEDLPNLNESLKQNESKFDRTSNVDNEWGRLVVKDAVTGDEVTLFMTYGQYQWSRMRTENQLNFIQVDGQPMYYTDRSKPHYAGDFPSPLPFNPNPAPGGKPCKPGSLDLVSLSAYANYSTCSAKKAQFMADKQAQANGNCEVILYRNICCNGANIGPLLFYPVISPPECEESDIPPFSLIYP